MRIEFRYLRRHDEKFDAYLTDRVLRVKVKLKLSLSISSTLLCIIPVLDVNNNILPNNKHVDYAANRKTSCSVYKPSTRWNQSASILSSCYLLRGR